MTKNVVSASPTLQKLFELLRRFPERLELFPGLVLRTPPVEIFQSITHDP